MCRVVAVEVGGLDTYDVAVDASAATVGDLKASVRRQLEVEEAMDLYLNDQHLADDAIGLESVGLGGAAVDEADQVTLTANIPELYTRAKLKRLEDAIAERKYEVIGVMGAVGGCEAAIADCIIDSFADDERFADLLAALVAAGSASCLNHTGSKRKTPLGLATEQQRTGAVKALLEAGASPDTPDMLKMTPLRIAVDRGFEEIFDALVDAKASADVVDLSKKTPLHYAAERGAAKMACRLLQDAHAKPSFVDINGRTPLYYASERGYGEIVGSLLKAGGDPNKTDRFGNAPLHFAAERGYDEVAQALLEHGASPDPLDSDQKSPLHLAAGHGHTATVLLLLRHNARVDVKDEIDRTPLDVAKLEGQVEVIDILSDPAGALRPKKAETGCVVM